jgi:predicted transcriptional regulator
MENSTNLHLLLSKLRQPLSLDFISNNILNVSEFEATEILNELIEDGIVKNENNYYSLKNNNYDKN